MMKKCLGGHHSLPFPGHSARFGKRISGRWYLKWKGGKKSLFQSCFVHLPGSDLQPLCSAHSSIPQLICPLPSLTPCGSWNASQMCTSMQRKLVPHHCPPRRQGLQTTVLERHKGIRQMSKQATRTTASTVSSFPLLLLLLQCRDCGLHVQAEHSRESAS